MSCHLTSDPRECMLRHAHARHHHDGVRCLRCKTGVSRMSQQVSTAQAAPERPHIMSKKRNAPAPAQPKRRGRPRKTEVCLLPVSPDAVRLALRDVLPLAEACAIGIDFLAERCEAVAGRIRDAGLVSQILATAGMTIFKAEIQFQGRAQRCVSVNKRLLTWLKGDSNAV